MGAHNILVVSYNKVIRFILLILVSTILKFFKNPNKSTFISVFITLDMVKYTRRESNPLPNRMLIYQRFYAIQIDYRVMCLEMCLDFLEINIFCEHLSRFIFTLFSNVGIDIHSRLNIRMTQSFHNVLYRYTSFK